MVFLKVNFHFRAPPTNLSLSFLVPARVWCCTPFAFLLCCALSLLQSCNNPSDAKAAIDAPLSSTSVVVVVVLIRRVVIDPKSDQFDFLRCDQNFVFSLFLFFLLSRFSFSFFLWLSPFCFFGVLFSRSSFEVFLLLLLLLLLVEFLNFLFGFSSCWIWLRETYMPMLYSIHNVSRKQRADRCY